MTHGRLLPLALVALSALAVEPLTQFGAIRLGQPWPEGLDPHRPGMECATVADEIGWHSAHVFPDANATNLVWHLEFQFCTTPDKKSADAVVGRLKEALKNEQGVVFARNGVWSNGTHRAAIGARQDAGKSTWTVRIVSQDTALMPL